MVTYSYKELILSMRLFLRFSGYCMCDGGLNLKQLSGFTFQFSEFGLLVETECSSMANAESVPGGTLETERS